MKKIYSVSSLVFASLLFLNSCKEKAPQAMPPQPVDGIKALKLDLPIYREFVGSIYGYKDIPIRARVEGFLETIDFNEGEMVQKGQLLYTIDSQPFMADVAAAQSKVAEAETKLVNAENELARYKPLAHTKAVSQIDVDAAQATRDAAEANLDAAKANLDMAEINLSYATMRSPIHGIIGRTAARVGEYVGRDPNPVILNTVSRLDTVRVQFFLSEAQYLTLVKAFVNRKESLDNTQESERAEVTLKLSDGSTYPDTGRIDFVDRNINTSTGAILVQASFPNTNKILRPGLYAKVQILFAYDKGSIMVPQRCVIETQGQYSVMVISDSNTIEPRQVKVGEKTNSAWQIVEGLKDGEKVVFEGLQKVQGGSKVVPNIVPFNLDLK
ncbi:efflux RND transporter periplasmic adaptor subunit [bacterium SCSIO 12643]|nr:efflux RND transporter periplasmic adaptor subunit [bacterium SCSIO 12643]